MTVMLYADMLCRLDADLCVLLLNPSCMGLVLTKDQRNLPKVCILCVTFAQDNQSQRFS